MSAGHAGGSGQATRDLDHKISAANRELKLDKLRGQLENIKNRSAFIGQDLQDSRTAGGDSSGDGFTMPQTNAMKIGGTVALDRLYGKSEPGGIHQILGTSNPGAGVNTNLFTVLGKHTARMSVLWAANRRLIKAKIRVGFDIAGGNTNIVPNDAWLYYNVEVPAESTLVLDAATGFWLGAADDVVVRTDISGVSFGASGVEYATV